MRRKDREIKDRTEIEEIIRKAEVCRIALCENNNPYIVPVNYGFKDGAIFIHSAKAGKKLDMIMKNNNVCFEIDADMEIQKGEDACNWGCKFKSVIGWGKAVILDTYQEKSNGLNAIMEHYAGKSDYEFSKAAMDAVEVIKIEIEDMTGKKCGY